MMLENSTENFYFKSIFDNQDESIIIINSTEEVIEYVNKRFYDQFENQIAQFITEDQ